MTKKLLAAVLSIFILPTQAQTYLQVNGASLHDQSGYNGFNPGLGIEQSVTENWAMAAGWYYNSEYRNSAYAYGRYSFYRQGAWDAGIALGAVTGYRRASVVPMAFPEICYAWLCAMAVPRIEATGSSVIGFHLRVPIGK